MASPSESGSSSLGTSTPEKLDRTTARQISWSSNLSTPEKMLHSTPLTVVDHPWSYPVEEILLKLDSNDPHGLSTDNARARLESNGRNELPDGPKPPSLLYVMLKQIFNAMSFVLLASMIATFSIGSNVEGVVIALVWVLNVAIGTWQVFSAEKKMTSLRCLSAPTANVVRDARCNNIPAGEVVAGDLVELTDGDTVPADIRWVLRLRFMLR
jgi:P-type Na+/K+ transporter